MQVGFLLLRGVPEAGLEAAQTDVPAAAGRAPNLKKTISSRPTSAVLVKAKHARVHTGPNAFVSDCSQTKKERKKERKSNSRRARTDRHKVSVHFKGSRTKQLLHTSVC